MQAFERRNCYLVLVRAVPFFHLPAQGADSWSCFSNPYYNPHSLSPNAKIRNLSPAWLQVHPEEQVFAYDLTYPHPAICSGADRPKQRPVVPPIPLHRARIWQAEQILKMGHLPKATPFHLGEASFCDTSLLILSSALGFIFLKYHLDEVTFY